MANAPYVKPHRWGQDVPLIGKSIAKFGHIGEIFSTPCSPQPQIIVKAFWQGLGKALWQIGKPTALSPHGNPASMTVFGSHGRKLAPPRTRRAAPLYRFNGELMPGPYIAWPPGLGWRILEVPTNLVRRAGWYFLIFDATANGLLTWTSMTYQYAGCLVHGIPHVWGKNVDEYVTPLTDKIGMGALNPFVNTGIAFGGGHAVIPAGATYTAYCNVTSQRIPGLDPFVPAKGLVENDGTGQHWSDGPLQEAPDGTFQHVTIARGQTAGAADEHVNIWIVGGGGWCNVKNSTLYIQLSLYDGVLPDP